jgi:hypothetical protein
MKNILFTIAILVFLLSSCNNNSSEKAGTHVHDDGTEHSDHDNGNEKTPDQEEFEVKDSLPDEKESLKSDDKTMHTHDDGHEHKQ